MSIDLEKVRKGSKKLGDPITTECITRLCNEVERLREALAIVYKGYHLPREVEPTRFPRLSLTREEYKTLMSKAEEVIKDVEAQ